jgi:hypothetical protein
VIKADGKAITQGLTTIVSTEKRNRPLSINQRDYIEALSTSRKLVVEVIERQGHLKLDFAGLMSVGEVWSAPLGRADPRY